ncbi:SDR family NAD(P)-dependent oxidoreductase [Tardiphaga sp. OK245]|uniref:SDR family NAD(P)-dependent oxidoreductase n=1 Tax=Tardiphaga sp. OK245 TaxID=1855306 RepID=UPI0011149B28|nr:SDR family NAD(P)-dependent oxidoreductase [Tardiphaga sp. OK245]
MGNVPTKVVIVTGASQGIGAGLVLGYRKAGWGVVANSRSIKAESYAPDDSILVVDGDIGNDSTADRLVARPLKEFGRIDGLVNNAGIFTAKPFTDYTETDLTSNLSVNVGGFSLHAAGDRVRRSGSPPSPSRRRRSSHSTDRFATTHRRQRACTISRETLLRSGRATASPDRTELFDLRYGRKLRPACLAAV